MKSLKNFLAAAIAATLFGVLSAGPVSAAPPQVGPSQASAQIAQSGDADRCAYTAAVSISLDGKSGTYTLDPTGKIAPGVPRVSSADCIGDASTDGASALAVTLGSKDFTSGSRTFAKTDTNGSFTAQYQVTGNNVVAWSYNISQALIAISTGNTSASVVRVPVNCNYSKTTTTNYPFHGSCQAHVFSSPYRLNGSFTFPIVVGGVRGTANIAWVFNYTVRAV